MDPGDHVFPRADLVKQLWLVRRLDVFRRCLGSFIALLQRFQGLDIDQAVNTRHGKICENVNMTSTLRWDPMRIVDDHEVTKSEQVTRFVFGALLGVVIAVAISYKFDISSLIWKVGVALVSFLGCGILALIQGDRFWQTIFGSSRFR